MIVEAIGQQGGFQEQIHTVVGVGGEPLQRLKLLLQGSGGGGIGLGSLAGKGVLPSYKGGITAVAVVGPHDPALYAFAGVVVPGFASGFPCHIWAVLVAHFRNTPCLPDDRGCRQRSASPGPTALPV